MNAEDVWQYAGAVGGCLYILDGLVLPQLRAWLDRRALRKFEQSFPGSGGPPPPPPMTDGPTMEMPPRPHWVRLVCEQCGESVAYPIYPTRGETACAKGAERPYLRPVISSRTST